MSKENPSRSLPAAFTDRELRRQRISRGIKGRYIRNWLFRTSGVLALIFGMLWVAFLFGDIGRRGIGAFVSWEITLNPEYDLEELDILDPNDPEELALADYRTVARNAVRSLYPGSGQSRQFRSRLYRFVGNGAELALYQRLKSNIELLGQQEQLWVPASRNIAKWLKPPEEGAIDETLQQHRIATELYTAGKLRRRFNTVFFTAADSRDADTAGIRAAVQGSLLSMLICLLISFPIGVATALYLEEFARRSYWMDLVEININNLAAVPSIIFGLLGLAVFLNWFGMPRSAPVVGGLVLSLMTLPTIIIAARASIKSVPPSLREGVLALGASRLQAVRSFILPHAMPGILTGTIIGFAGALGETAPLLMIGMVAFIAEASFDPTAPATALPVQIFLWADNPEQSFVELTSAAIMVLIAFLIAMNATAVLLRQKLQHLIK